LFIFYQQFFKRWQKNGSFGFLSVGLSVGKKPNVPFAGRLFTLSDNVPIICVRWGLLTTELYLKNKT
jgi:hypothetical protein